MRRTRFTATVCRLDRQDAPSEKRVILAYDPVGVRKHYNRMGYVVLDVVKGDHRREAYKAAVKSSGGFTVDRRALKDACDLLGITKPVRIRFSSKVGSTNGNYRFMGTYHDIMLKSYHSPAQASSTLWHELTHAMQAERAGGTQEAWQAEHEKSKGKYKRCPREIEARQMSRKMADVPLCR